MKKALFIIRDIIGAALFIGGAVALVYLTGVTI